MNSNLRTERLGDEPVRSGLGRVRTAEEDVELGRTRAIRNTDRSREHDAAFFASARLYVERRGEVRVQVGRRDVVPLYDGGLGVDNLVKPQARVEVGLDVREDRDRAVRTSTATSHYDRQNISSDSQKPEARTRSDHER